MENICPHCDRHCPVNDLHCRRGREYFGVKEEQPIRPEEKMIVLLRKCGHFLHHNVGPHGDAAPLLSALSPEERATLEQLLEKCLESWQSLQEHEV